MGDEGSFFGLKVPEGTDRRELYKSQYRGIWTYKMSASELDEAFRTAVTGDGPDGGWSIKNDERVKYVGKLELAKGEDQTLKVRAHPPCRRDVAWHFSLRRLASRPFQLRADEPRPSHTAHWIALQRPASRPSTIPCPASHGNATRRAGDDGGLPRGRHVGAQVLHHPVVHQVDTLPRQ